MLGLVNKNIHVTSFGLSLEGVVCEGGLLCSNASIFSSKPQCFRLLHCLGGWAAKVGSSVQTPRFLAPSLEMLVTRFPSTG